MGVHLRTVTRWEIGEIAVPRVAELALRYIAEHAKKEDAADLKQARASLKEAKEKGTVAWEKIKKTSTKREGRKHG
jgi:hypothetical protein